MSRNVIRRESLRQADVECPLCYRQIARPGEQVVVFGAGAETVANADAVECPACRGVTFVAD